MEDEAVDDALRLGFGRGSRETEPAAGSPPELLPTVEKGTPPEAVPVDLEKNYLVGSDVDAMWPEMRLDQ